MYITVYPSGLCKLHKTYPNDKVGAIFYEGSLIENFGLIYPEWIQTTTKSYTRIIEDCAVAPCPISWFSL